MLGGLIGGLAKGIGGGLLKGAGGGLLKGAAGAAGGLLKGGGGELLQGLAGKGMEIAQGAIENAIAGKGAEGAQGAAEGQQAEGQKKPGGMQRFMQKLEAAQTPESIDELVKRVLGRLEKKGKLDPQTKKAIEGMAENRKKALAGPGAAAAA